MAAVLAACVFLAFASFGPAPSLRRFEFSEPYMGTTFTVVLYAPDGARAARASGAAFARIAGLDARLSDYRQNSEAMRLTREAVGRAVRVSDDLYRVLALSLSMSSRTGGAFDVTVGPLSHLWRRARRQAELPHAADVDAARAVSGSALVHIDAASRSVRLARAGMRLDFGGIAKGYAADRALETLRDAGIRRALVVAGGDIAAGEPPPGERGWRVAIAPFDTATPGATRSLTLANAAVSTSGDAEQWVEIGGVRYSHIFDPRTGWPLTGRRQATVVARDATTSDMLATTLCVLGEDGLRLADRTPGAAAMIGVTDGAGPIRWAFSRRWGAYARTEVPAPHRSEMWSRDFSPGRQCGWPGARSCGAGSSVPAVLD
jgi:FAD:protein FMN transferase